MPFILDPEVGAGLGALFGGPPPPKAPAGDVEARRAGLDGLWTLLMPNFLPADEGVSRQHFTTTASDGHTIRCSWTTKHGHSNSPSTPGPALLHIHGGGMICLSIAQYEAIIATYVRATGVPMLSVEYRLAPEVRAPVPVTDAYAGLQLLVSRAHEWGIDPSRIGLFGDSAGAGIAASLAYHAKTVGGPPIARQILIYPMLDDRNTSGPDPETAPFATWTNDDNITGWGALLGDRMAGPDVKPTEAAGRITVEQARGLPPAYIEVGELDIFRDEDLQFARTLTAAGVSAEFHLLPGVPHAFEAFAAKSEVAKLAMQLRFRAISSL